MTTDPDDPLTWMLPKLLKLRLGILCVRSYVYAR